MYHVENVNYKWKIQREFFLTNTKYTVIVILGVVTEI